MPNALKIALTVAAISFSTFFFLPRTLDELGRLTWNLLSASHLASGRLFEHVELTANDVWIAFIACAFVVAFETWQRKFNATEKPAVIRTTVYVSLAVVLVMTTVAVGVGNSKAFFYLRF